MKIRMQRPDKLIPYEGNPRIIPDEAVNAVAESIRDFGFRQPIVVDRNNVVTIGHTRLKASLQLGLDKVPTIIADDLSDEDIRKLRLSDNRTGEMTGWDIDLLTAEVVGIDELPGFHSDELEALKAHDDITEAASTIDGSASGQAPGLPSPTDLHELTFYVRREIMQEAKAECEKVIDRLEKAADAAPE